MEKTEAEHLVAIERATRRIESAHTDQEQAIKEAVHAGVGISAVARSAKVSRATVYRITGQIPRKSALAHLCDSTGQTP